MWGENEAEWVGKPIDEINGATWRRGEIGGRSEARPYGKTKGRVGPLAGWLLCGGI
jgi:hypothetical protein